MPASTPRQILRRARSMVVKIGSQVLTGPDGLLDGAYFTRIAADVAALHERGIALTLVSSGAVAAGVGELGLTATRPKSLAALQAVAAVGQNRLMSLYHQALAVHRIPTAQLLLTRSDFDHRGRFLNIRNCVHELHELGCLPILNENDTVAVEELRFGDNDLLAALLANAIKTDVLVMLTSVDGLLGENGHRVDLVEDPASAMHLVRAEQTASGRGGMRGKLEAAARVTGAGEVAVIASGREEGVLEKLMRGEDVGTVFVPRPQKLSARRRWIGLTKRPLGAIEVDAGAARALTDGQNSLLPIGVTGATGTFGRGDLVRVVDPEGREVARGLTNYASEEIDRVRGARTHEIPDRLGRPGDTTVIHRDNLAPRPAS